MTLENQVVSLEIAKKLKELGVKQLSIFWWQHEPFSSQGEQNWKLVFGNQYKDFEHHVFAFTVAELGEMLPTTLKERYFLHIAPPHTVGVWVLWYEDEDYEKMFLNKKEGEWHVNDKSEADARGKMLIYLLENKLITL